jgi:very-short-patch-repair endonuclease
MEKLFKRVENDLLQLFEERFDFLSRNLGVACESPIEEALAAAMIGSSWFNRVVSLELIPQLEEERFAGLGVPLLIPQYEWQGKRIDFKYVDKPVEIFIECDGHDFHERMPHQATRDRKKDRLIQSAGIPILRFTGSEIYRDPLTCAYEIFGFADARRLELSKPRQES